jgi:hypothetical protein
MPEQQSLFFWQVAGGSKHISGVGVAVGIAVGVAVGVDVGVAVGVALGVALGVAEGVAVGVAVGVALGVAVGVDVGVAVGVDVGVAVGVAVGVDVGVAVGVDVGVAVGVDVGVAVGVAVGVVVGVAVGVGSTPARAGDVSAKSIPDTTKLQNRFVGRSVIEISPFSLRPSGPIKSNSCSLYAPPAQARWGYSMRSTRIHPKNTANPVPPNSIHNKAKIVLFSTS